jgi:hypothetical protein
MATQQQSPRPGLPTFAQTINQEHAAGESATREGLQHYRAAGVAVIKAKAACKRTRTPWGKWLKANTKVTRMTANRYERLARKWRGGNVTLHVLNLWRRICGNKPKSKPTSPAPAAAQVTQPPPQQSPPQSTSAEQREASGTKQKTAKPQPPDDGSDYITLNKEDAKAFHPLANDLMRVWKMSRAGEVVIHALRLAHGQEVRNG